MTWPAPSGATRRCSQTAATILGQIRKAKSEAKVSMRAEASRVIVRGPDDELMRACAGDLLAAGNIAKLSFVPTPGGELTTEVTLAAREPVVRAAA